MPVQRLDSNLSTNYITYSSAVGAKELCCDGLNIGRRRLYVLSLILKIALRHRLVYKSMLLVLCKKEVLGFSILIIYFLFLLQLLVHLQ